VLSAKYQNLDLSERPQIAVVRHSRKAFKRFKWFDALQNNN